MKKQIKVKEPIRLRAKKIANENESLYLDCYYNGKRQREFLKLYIVPERTKEDKEKNRHYTLFTLIFKKITFMIITFKLFVIFAPNIQIRLDFSNHCNDIK